MLFLCTFFSVAVQAQYSENEDLNDWIANALEQDTDSHLETNEDGDLTITNTYTDGEYDDYLNSTGGDNLCQEDHTSDPNTDGNEHIVITVIEDDGWGDFMQDYNDWVAQKEEEEQQALDDYYDSFVDEQYPPEDDNTGGDSISESASDTNESKPDDCPTANCPKTYRVKAGTCDCVKSKKYWYTDNDADGWFANIKSATESPGKGWIDNDLKPAKGQDCDDTKPSVDNICAPIDICAEIKKQQADAKYKTMMAELEDPNTLALHHETGYWQDKKGDFNKMAISGTRGVAMPNDISSLQNINHVHMNDWVDPVTGISERSYSMPSPRDISKVYSIYDNSRTNSLDLGNAYVGNVSSLGSFQMRFTGTSDNLTVAESNKLIDLINSEEYDKAYEKAMLENGDVAGLLVFLRDTLKRTDIAVYQIEATGASKLELDATNQVVKIACN